MRPPEFTGGNFRLERREHAYLLASMRPPEFTGGNPPASPGSRTSRWARFNEAAGIHRRKLPEKGA